MMSVRLVWTTRDDTGSLLPQRTKIVLMLIVSNYLRQN